MILLSTGAFISTKINILKWAYLENLSINSPKVLFVPLSGLAAASGDFSFNAASLLSFDINSSRTGRSLLLTFHSSRFIKLIIRFFTLLYVRSATRLVIRAHRLPKD